MRNTELLTSLKKISKNIDKNSEVVQLSESTYRIFVSKSEFSIPIKRLIRKTKNFKKERIIYPDVRIPNVYLIIEIEKLRNFNKIDKRKLIETITK